MSYIKLKNTWNLTEQKLDNFTENSVYTDNIKEYIVSNPIKPSEYFGKDLIYISGLDKNKHYEISFNHLSLSFKSNNDGKIYFNKDHTGLPLSCLIYVIIGIHGRPISSLQAPISGKEMPLLKNSFKIGLINSKQNCQGCSSNNDINCFNTHFCYGNNPQCYDDFANTEVNCKGLSQCNWGDVNKTSCNSHHNCIWSDKKLEITFSLQYPIPNTTNWGQEDRKMIIQNGIIS